jgi:hypothetical protein
MYSQNSLRRQGTVKIIVVLGFALLSRADAKPCHFLSKGDVADGYPSFRNFAGLIEEFSDEEIQGFS